MPNGRITQRELNRMNDAVLMDATYDQLWALLITELGQLAGVHRGDLQFTTLIRRMRWCHAVAVELRRRGHQGQLV